MEIDDSHFAAQALKELLPDGKTSGGSFLSSLEDFNTALKADRQAILIAQRKIARIICLRSLLKQFPDYEGEDLVQGNGGEIIWPRNLTGSLSHKGTVILAAAIHKTISPYLGIDVERIGHENMGKIALTVAPEGIPPQLSESIATLAVFSAKEAVFKAQFPMTQRRIEFSDVKIAWDQFPSGRQHRGLADCLGLPFAVKVLIGEKWIVSCATLYNIKR